MEIPKNTRPLIVLLVGHAALVSGCNKAANPGDSTTPASATPAPSDDKGCGGLAGRRCASGEFCNMERAAGGQGCGVADGMGVCTAVPTMCTYEYRAVCGCDGETYPTACVAHSKSMSVAHEGECEAPQNHRSKS